jgi:SH3/ankyrin repeat-containing protein
VLQELKESFNYGLFCPPVNGKAGKFLDEERRLGDYPFSGPVGYLEVRGSLVLFCGLCTVSNASLTDLLPFGSLNVFVTHDVHL